MGKSTAYRLIFYICQLCCRWGCASARLKRGNRGLAIGYSMRKTENMEYQNLLIEQKEDIRIITIHRPQDLNALNTELLSELDCAFADASADAECTVVILTGEGKSFVAGADIAQMAAMDAAEAKAFGEFGADVFRRIETMGKVVIAAVNGYALGGGCELAMACDIRIASSKAKIGQPETGLGITPGFNGTQRLPRLVGLGRAKEIILAAETMDAMEAYRIGLFNKVVEPDQLMDAAMSLARKIASKAQLAVRYSKEAMNEGVDGSFEAGMGLEANLFALCFATEDQKEGMKAFLEKRPAVFKGK